MSKHRKKQHYRRIVIAAVAFGAVGVPTAAMACTGWDPTSQAAGAQQPTSQGQGGDPSPWHKWNQAWWGGDAGAATPSAAQAPTATPHAHKHHPHKHHAIKHHAPEREHPARPHKPAATPSAPSAPSTPKTTAPTTTAPTTTAPAAPSTPKPTTTAESTAPASGTVARIVQLVNDERGKVGCSALKVNATLTKAAQAHSDDMATHRNMSHTGSDGSSPGDRITSAGYSWSAYGENVAYGYSTPEQVMAGWMSSSGHRANILNCSFKEIGVGLAQPGSYWTQDFGTAR
ncbi:CAP domain-containing protein [Streptomyces sp. NPDC002520]